MRINKTYRSAVAFLNNQCRRSLPSLFHAITVKVEKDRENTDDGSLWLAVSRCAV